MVLCIGISCEGPEGEPGPQGAPGPAGPQGPQGPAGAASREGIIFDLPPVTLNAENGYEVGFEFEDSGIEILETDIIMVYIPYGAFQDVPVWTPLPLTEYHDGEPLKFNYAFSHLALFLFIEAQEEVLAALDPDLTADLHFRVAVLPALAPGDPNGRIIQPRDLNTLSYEEMIDKFGIKDKDVQKFNF